MCKPDLNPYYHWVAQDPSHRQIDIRIEGTERVFYSKRDNPIHLSVWARDYRASVFGNICCAGEDIDQRLAELRRSDIALLERQLATLRAAEQDEHPEEGDHANTDLSHS